MRPKRILISVPTFGTLDVEWVTRFMALAGPLNATIHHCWPVNLPVAEARNRSVEAAIERECDYLLFIDYDVLVQPDALTRLVARELPVVGALYYSKSKPPEPVALVDGRPATGWEQGDVIAVDVIGMGCTLLDVEFLKVMDGPWFATTDDAGMVDGEPTRTQSTEDSYFCERVTNETDARPCIDTGVLCEHKDLRTGAKFYMDENTGVPTWEDEHGKHTVTSVCKIIDLTKKESEKECESI